MADATGAAAEFDPAVPERPFPVRLTARAAKMVQEAMAQDGAEGQGLRVGVVGGGCSGLQYQLDFTPGGSDDDYAGESHAVALYVDPYSAAHLEGTEVDYVDDLQGTGFKFNNPNVTRACGCGSSFAT